MNKTILTLSAITTLTFFGCSQKEPQAVTDGFSKKFPNAQHVKWDKENEKEWEAEFKMDNKEYSANFSLDGKWLETEIEMEENQLPATIKDAIKKEFDTYEIEEAEQVITPEYEGYEVEVEVKETEYILIFKNDGTLVKKETKKED